MKFPVQLVGGMLLSLVLVACHAPADDASSTSTVQLKLYKVPTQQSSAIRQSLQHVLAGSKAGSGGRGGDSGMRVTEPFPGTLMVLAPESIQQSINGAIAALDETSAKTKSPAQLQLHFWIVDAHSGAGVDDPALEPLASTLNRLRASLRPSHFTLDETVAAAATLGKAGQIITGAAHKFSFEVLPSQGGSIDLEIQYVELGNTDVKQGVASLNTTVAMTPGRYVVIAQASNPAQTSHKPPSLAPAMRLLVARVDRIAPAPH